MNPLRDLNILTDLARERQALAIACSCNRRRLT